MAVTITEKQGNKLKNKVKKYFLKSRPHLENGLCPTKDLIAATVDKWSMFVLFNLGYHKILRFNELKKNIDGISSRMLSVTLKKLEKSGMVERNIFAEIPPKV
ncbi:MAG TPA: transcriptional regulator, partial [Bacteroidetes bacterium]|nr:transcriptional regulator [Bacteroidota bacterium]